MNLNKRQKIIIASVLVTLGLFSTQLTDFNLRFRFLMGLSILTAGGVAWALWEGLNKTKLAIFLILPTFFTLGVASFYFILPIRWLTRLPVAFCFGLLFYLLLLSQNVFNVAAQRTIPLYRVASTASMIFTILTAFFLFSVLHAFNLLFIWNGLLVFFLSMPLVLQNLWTLEMEDKISASLILQAFIISLGLGEVALALSFWPMNHFMWAIMVSSAAYILLGLSIENHKQKLSRRVVWEYLGIGTAFFLVAFLTSTWTS